MKIQRFILPAFLAAALHAVLLFAIPTTEVDAIIRPPEVIAVVLPPMPSFPVEPPIEMANTDSGARPVKPVSDDAGVPRPTLPDSSTGADARFEILVDNTSRQPVDVIGDLRKIPGDFSSGPGEWGPGARLLDASVLDRTPRARAQPAPEYPLALRRDQIEGEVLVEFDVDADGRVVDVRVISSERREFSEAAVRAVMRWRFEPGRKDGRPVSFRMRQPLSFSLTEG